MSEPFECRNCFHIGSLDRHGRCEECGSDSVIPQALIELERSPLPLPA